MSLCLRRAESCGNRGSGDGSAESLISGTTNEPTPNRHAGREFMALVLQVMAGQSAKRVFALDVPAIHVFGVVK